MKSLMEMLNFFNKQFEVRYYICIQETCTVKVKQQLSIKFLKRFNQ